MGRPLEATVRADFRACVVGFACKIDERFADGQELEKGNVRVDAIFEGFS